MALRRLLKSAVLHSQLHSIPFFIALGIPRKDKAFTAANKTLIFEQAIWVVARQTPSASANSDPPLTPRQVAAVYRICRAQSRSVGVLVRSTCPQSWEFFPRSSSWVLIVTPTWNWRRCAAARLKLPFIVDGQIPHHCIRGCEIWLHWLPELNECNINIHTALDLSRVYLHFHPKAAGIERRTLAGDTVTKKEQKNKKMECTPIITNHNYKLNTTTYTTIQQLLRDFSSIISKCPFSCSSACLVSRVFASRAEPCDRDEV